VTVRLAIPGTTPVLQLQQFLRSFFDEGFDRILIAQPVAAGDGVVGVFVETVVGFRNAGRTAFSRDGVAPHGIDLGDDSNTEFGIDLSGSDGGPKARTSAPYEKNVVRRSFH